MGRWVCSSARRPPRSPPWTDGLYLTISLMLIAPTWSNKSTKRASSRLDAVLHLDTCVLVPTVPYHRSLLDWFQFPSLHPTPSSTTLHDDPHDPRQPFTLESCPRRHSEALLTKSDCISRTASPLEGDHQSPTLHERSSRSLLTPLQRQPAC